MSEKQKVVIIGSGWGGYRLVYGIDHRKYDITLISPENTSTVTPLLASAACGLFDPRLAHEPIRRKDFHAKYIKALVLDIDFGAQTLTCQPAFEQLKDERFEVPYDKVIITPGCRSNTFGIPGVAENAIFVKNVANANTVRSRLNDILEMASLPGTSEARQRQLLHIVVVGGGPTGIEVAAELTDLFDGDLGVLFPHLKDKTSVSVHDVAPQILAPFDRKLSEYACTSLKSNKVTVKLNSHILNVTADTIETKEEGATGYGMLIWATGNKSIPLIDSLKLRKTEQGLVRLLTDDHLNVFALDGAAMPNVFAMGDAADIEGGTLPTTAEVAIQKADYLIKLLNSGGKATQPFQYKQRSLVTYTGAWDGVIQGKREYTGYGAWLSWRSGNFFWTHSIREIRNNKLPLAYAQVDPSKIVFGVAWYGRGYTLSDPSCNTFGCGFAGPSKPGKCTNSAGVLSLVEIQQMIKSDEAKSRLNRDAAMKELVWEDQRVGYDDEETVELKRRFANDQCFGSLMAWSVDFNCGTGDGDNAPVSADGRCGPQNGGADGCGSTDDHCGTDCISGKCVEKGISTNGRCGAGFHGAKCVGSDFGSCCSSGGWCGDSTSHCGEGCQSGSCDGEATLPGGNGNANTGGGEEEEEEGEPRSNAIAPAYKDVNKLVNQNYVKANIPFDGPEADDWFGPESQMPVVQQRQIQAVFANAAKVSDGSWFNPLKWIIKVRCKEPKGLSNCRLPAENDPCRPPRRPWEGKTIAYSANRKGTYNNPMIMFCPAFFDLPNLDSVITAGRASPYAQKIDISEYQCTAHTFLHELMHLWLASDSRGGSPNPRWEKHSVYGPALSKLLARYQPALDDDPPAGFYTQRNAENLAYYALTVYIEMQVGEYPYLPLVLANIDIPPTDNKGRPILPPSMLRTLSVDQDGKAYSDIPNICDDTLYSESKPQGNSKLVSLEKISAHGKKWHDFYGANIKELQKSSDDVPDRDLECRSSDSLTAHETDIRFVVNKLCSNKAYWDKQIVPAISTGDGRNRALGQRIAVVPAGEDDPLKPPSGGDIKCEDYKVNPELEDADRFKGTCRCWLTSNHDATDVFKKPDGTAKCSNIKKRLIPFVPGLKKREAHAHAHREKG
ncbi:hypothetical protein ACJZ2D_009295 [Fusarium nematophilum]